MNVSEAHELINDFKTSMGWHNESDRAHCMRITAMLLSHLVSRVEGLAVRVSVLEADVAAAIHTWLALSSGARSRPRRETARGSCSGIGSTNAT